MSQQPHTGTICEETSPSPVPLPPPRDENDRTMAVESKEAGWAVAPPGRLQPWSPKPVSAQDPRPTSGSADTPPPSHHHQVTRSSIQDTHVKIGVCFKCKCSFQTRAPIEIHRLGCCKSCCNQHEGLCIFLNLCFHFFG